MEEKVMIPIEAVLAETQARMAALQQENIGLAVYCKELQAKIVELSEKFDVLSEKLNISERLDG